MQLSWAFNRLDGEVVMFCEILLEQVFYTEAYVG